MLQLNIYVFFILDCFNNEPKYYLVLNLVFCFIVADYLECQSHSPRCVSSTDALNSRFVCPDKGRFPVPGRDTSLFLKCPRAGYYACDCACVQGKYFDDLTGNCRRPNLRHPSRKEEWLSGSSTAKTLFSKETHRYSVDSEPIGVNNPNVDRVSLSILDEDSIDNKHIIIHPLEDIHVPAAKATPAPPDDPGGDWDGTSGVKNTGQFEDAVNVSATARQVEDKHGDTKLHYHTVVLRDNSAFPAWAIALTVLCLVILMVLVIMIAY